MLRHDRKQRFKEVFYGTLLQQCLEEPLPALTVDGKPFADLAAGYDAANGRYTQGSPSHDSSASSAIITHMVASTPVISTGPMENKISDECSTVSPPMPDLDN